MKSYFDLEMNILSCIVQKPELMETTKLEDKYFIKNRKLWKFLKSFYARFKTFDLVLMYQMCKDKYKIIEYIQWLTDVEPNVGNFAKYEDKLIQMFEENKKDKYIIDKIFDLANDLYVGNTQLSTFQSDVEGIFKRAEEIFRKED